MMSEWQMIKAKDFIHFNPTESIKKGATAKKVAMEQIRPFTKRISAFDYAPFNGGAKYRNGDTLMARITPCLENGKTAFVDVLDDGEIGFGSTEFIVLRERCGISDKDYVYYLTISQVFRNTAIRSMVGSSGRQRVQQSVLDEMELFVPPLYIQKEIGKTLALIDAKIALNNRINHHLEQIAQAIFKSWFVDFEPWGGVMPDEWIVGALSDIANVTMGQSPAGESYNENGEGVIFYQGRTDFGQRFPTRRLFTTQPKRMAEKGDILISVRAPVGDLNVAIEPCCVGRGLAAIQSKNCYQSFILYTMHSLQEKMNVFNGEGTVFGSINKTDMANLPVIVPSEIEIIKFNQIIAPLDALIESNSMESVFLSSLRDTLLPRLLSGELSVSDLPNIS
jgi:type I restriction enzyme S subunit